MQSAQLFMSCFANKQQGRLQIVLGKISHQVLQPVSDIMTNLYRISVKLTEEKLILYHFSSADYGNHFESVWLLYSKKGNRLKMWSFFSPPHASLKSAQWFMRYFGRIIKTQATDDNHYVVLKLSAVQTVCPTLLCAEWVGTEWTNHSALFWHQPLTLRPYLPVVCRLLLLLE